MLLYQREVVIVTGAARGIGRVIALTYARAGGIIALLDRDLKGLKETRDLIHKRARNCETFEIDLTSESSILTVVESIYQRYERIDILINNAGLGKTISPLELTVDDWDYILNTNLRGTFLMSRESARYMRYNGGGSIVNIASTRAIMSEANTEAYAASKGGILALTHAMSMSFAKDNIAVNAVSPGWIEVGDYGLLRDEDHQQHPSGRVGTPEDIANACVFLTNPENSFVTGTNLVIDGGMTKKMIYSD